AAVVIGVAVSEALAVGLIASFYGLKGLPGSVYAIDALVAMVLIGGSRFAERGLFRVMTSLKDRSERQRTLVVGAGRSGRSLLRELRETPGQQVVGFVDDDPALRRRRLQGVPVLGGSRDLARILQAARPDTVLVTIPAAPRDVLDGI